MRLLPLLALSLGLVLLGAAPTAVAPGMKVGVRVCFEAIPIACVDACAETFLSPPDLCPEIRVPI